MALKQKLLSISLVASTLLGVGVSAQEKEPQKQPVPAAQTIPAAGEAAPEIGGRGDLFLDTANRRIAWVNFAPGGIGSFYVGTY